MDIDALLKLGRVGALALGADRVVATIERQSDDGARFVSDLWSFPLANEAPIRLTRGDHRDRAPAFDGERLLFLSDRKVGAEDEAKTQVWALPAQGEAYPLTAEPLGVSAFRVANQVLVVMTEVHDGVPREALAEHERDRKKRGPSVLHYRAMPVRFWDHWLGPTRPTLLAFDLNADPACRAPRDLTPDAGEALREADWDLSPDGRALVTTFSAIQPQDRIADRALVEIDTATGAARTRASAPRVVHGVPRVAAQGLLAASRYARRDEGYGARELWLFPKDGEARALTAGWDRWPSPCGWRDGANGPCVVITYEARGQVRLAEVSLDGEVHPLGPETYQGAPFSWEQCEVHGDLLVGVVSRLLHPPELVLLDLKAHTLTPLSPPPLPAPTATWRELDVPVPDRPGRTVHTLMVEPAAPNGRTILWIHGGPVAAWAHRWHWRWCARLMADQGFRVVLPNPAGSTGYGLDWVDDIWGNTWGGQCYEDLMAVVAHLEAHGSPARQTVVMGGSFGGYMTNWIGCQTDRFALLVTHASLFSLSGFQGDTDMPAWWELMMGGSPYDGADLDRFSPARQVKNWKTPVLILHGERDYRVPIGEGLALFEALTRQGTEAELAVFPDEHHWILKPRNIAAWYSTVLDFIARRWPTG